MGHGGEVHHLLHGALAQHGEARLAAGHHILVVAEDAERVRGQCTCRHVEDAGKELAGNLVHVGNHQQEALRCGEGGGEGAGLQRAVNSTCCTSLRLHLLHVNGLAPQVLAATGSPFVYMLRHG